MDLGTAIFIAVGGMCTVIMPLGICLYAYLTKVTQDSLEGEDRHYSGF